MRVKEDLLWYTFNVKFTISQFKRYFQNEPELRVTILDDEGLLDNNFDLNAAEGTNWPYMLLDDSLYLKKVSNSANYDLS